MKKLFLSLGLVVLLTGNLLALEPIGLLPKIISGYQSHREFEQEFTISMDLLGSRVKVYGYFRQKNDKYRMDTRMPLPGTGEMMEQSVIYNNNTVTEYDSKRKLVFQTDLGKFSRAGRENYMTGFFYGNIYGLVPCLISGRVREAGKSFYLLEIENNAAISAHLPLGEKASFFKRIVFRIRRADYLITRVEFFGDSSRPGMWFEFKEIKDGPVSEEKFRLAPVPDAKVIDLTEALKSILEPAGEDSAQDTQS